MEDKVQADLSQNESEINLFRTVCNICKEQNLINNIYLGTCLKCQNVYCVHFASTIDPAYCSSCCGQVTMTDQTVFKKTEHYNEEKDKTYTKTSKARQIQFSGLDWLFFQRRIETINDTELLLAIEYHRAIYNKMMYERDQRRAEYAHRNASKNVIFRTSTSDSSKVITTKVKKTRTIRATSPDKTAANIQSMLEVLIKQGKSKEEILAMFGAK